MNKSNSPYIIKDVYNTQKSNNTYWEFVIRKVNIKVFFKPSGLKYDYNYQGYIHYFNRIRTKQ